MRSGRSSHTDTRGEEERRGGRGEENKTKGEKGIEEECIIIGRTKEEMVVIHTLVLLKVVHKLKCRHSLRI